MSASELGRPVVGREFRGLTPTCCYHTEVLWRIGVAEMVGPYNSDRIVYDRLHSVAICQLHLLYSIMSLLA